MRVRHPPGPAPCLDERPQMCSDSLPLLRGQRLLHRFGHCRDLRVRCRAAEAFPLPRLDRSNLGFELQLDGEEPRLLSVPYKIALVEVEHRIEFRRLKIGVDGRNPCRKLTQPIDRVKPEQLFVSLVMPEAIDWFVNRDPATGPKDAEELVERPLLSLDKDQHRARGDDVDAPFWKRSEIDRIGFEEATAVEVTKFLGSRSANRDQIGGDVAENHGARPTRERPETDQAVPTADIKKCFAGLQRRAVENPIANPQQALHELGALVGARGITAEPTAQQPLRPAILLPIHLPGLWTNRRPRNSPVTFTNAGPYEKPRGRTPPTQLLQGRPIARRP